MAEPEAEKSPKPKSKILRLNVGGEVFATAPETLMKAGESFFSSLLSGRHESERDETGAYFIDRSPKYFEPLLYYLRSGVLEIPPGISRTALLREADFYGLQSIVDHIQQIEADKKKKEPPKKVLPFSKDVGCYVDETNSHAFTFSLEGERVVFISGTEAFTQALVIHSHPQVPAEWKNDQTHERSFAQFYQSHVQKGTFKMNKEGRGLLLTLPGTSPTSLRQHLASLSKDFTSLCVTSFSCTAGQGVFLCNHDNPHHFHLYKFHRF